LLQGWPTEQELRRGPLHLGELLQAACLHSETCPAAAELWELWEATCGLTGTEAVLKLGEVARLVTVTTGPLHIHLNGCTDAYKFHGNTFLRPFYKAWTGREWTDKPKVNDPPHPTPILLLDHAWYTHPRRLLTRHVCAVCRGAGRSEPSVRSSKSCTLDTCGSARRCWRC